MALGDQINSLSWSIRGPFLMIRYCSIEPKGMQSILTGSKSNLESRHFENLGADIILPIFPIGVGRTHLTFPRVSHVECGFNDQCIFSSYVLIERDAYKYRPKVWYGGSDNVGHIHDRFTIFDCLFIKRTHYCYLYSKGFTVEY